ncbi:MAG TPA: protein kinase [Thermoanaerobaculia bacterium]|nr:protein kinase [Thermoanaerobaculia bacterium]
MALTPGSKLGSYSILDRIGSGGMGEVHRAHDDRLGREVAVKALPEEFSRDPDRVLRFEREARMLAALNHPAVAAIYGLEEADGQKFIVMELVRGETLSEKLSKGPLPLGEALGIAGQIAEGLEAAHEHGIIHRDLKPANIKVTPEGRVKVLDLGLAKAFDTKESGPESDPSLSPTVVMEGTQPGVILGTAEFMSPEQARGKAIDKRTDIWAFGCILYELLTGRRAFTGETVTDVLVAIVTTEPRWDLVPAATPDRVRELLGRCLQKDPARRLRDVGDARMEIEEARADVAPPRARSGPGAVPSLPAEPPMEPSRSTAGSRRALAAGILLLVLAAVGTWFTLRPRPAGPVPGRKYLAVLPFKDLSATPGGRLIGDGFVETVSARLSGVSGIQVVTPTASITASDKSSEIHRIARDLGANLLLRGTYQRQGERVRITYSVFNTADGMQIAAETLDGSASDLFDIQDRLAEHVAASLRLPATPRRPARPTGLETGGQQERYLSAVGHLQRYDRPERIAEGIRLLEALAAERPSAALVHASLGRAYLHQFNLTRDRKWVALAASACDRARSLNPDSPDVNVTQGELDLRTGRPLEAMSAFERALAAQPNNFEATTGLARAQNAGGDPGRAEETYKRAIALQPAYFGGYSTLAGFYFTHGRFAEAAAMFDRVTRLTPDNARAFANLGASYFALGHFDRALEVFQKSVGLQPTDLAYSNIGTAQYYLGRFPESAAAFEKAVALSPSHYMGWTNLGDALRMIPGREAKASQAYEKGIALARAELATNPDDHQVHSQLALGLAKTGRASEARKHLGKALASGENSPEILFNAAVVANRAGRPDEAVGFLAGALRAGLNAAVIRNEPELANLRKRADFEKVVR